MLRIVSTVEFNIKFLRLLCRLCCQAQANVKSSGSLGSLGPAVLRRPASMVDPDVIQTHELNIIYAYLTHQRTMGRRRCAQLTVASCRVKIAGSVRCCLDGWARAIRFI
ncbi:hypothetical protein VFPBJ_09089 [Purpureocillium lilacinum]|uniref:Uncharacterized protein n=1 Tax=Purpureocillium lilacinum TaxID=33203 RepID=A0A179GBC4_PURLI|nr:hypothetical protein VFPBJ_09089 [Purpureocillium lilacinum]